MKMMYKNIFLLAILAAQSNLFGMHFARNGWQHTKNFFTTAQGFEKGMKKLTTGAFFTITFGLPAAEFIQTYQDVMNIPQVSPEVDKFVRNTLREKNYPEKLCSSVRLIPAAPDSTICSPGSIAIAIPFSATQIRKAYKLQRGDIENLELEEPVSEKDRLHDDLIEKLKEYQLPSSLPKDIKDSVLTEYGLAKKPDTLTLWKNAVIHEGSHIYNRDAWQQGVLACVWPLLVHKAGKKVSTILQNKFPRLYTVNPIIRGLSTLPILPLKVVCTAFCVISGHRTLGKYHEWRADHDIINRTTDPVALEQEAQYYKNELLLFDFIDQNLLKEISYQKQNAETQEEYLRLTKQEEKLINKIERDKKYPWLQEFSDEHPRPQVRAAYFEKAAKELRKKQEQ